MTKERTLFAQSDVADDVQTLDVPETATAADVVQRARASGLAREDDGDLAVYVEDEEEPLAPTAKLPATSAPCRIHIGPRGRIEVTVHYNRRDVKRAFSPAATIESVRRWAAGELKLSPTETERHALQHCDTTVRPPERRHLGALDRNRDRQLCFDLIPKQRFQGATPD